jgi:Questin oxidase-like
MITRHDALDDAFDRFGAYRYVDGIGFAFHGPMGAEALSSLGHHDLVAGWADEYTIRHEPIDAPPPVARLDPDDETTWRLALGDPGRVSDWAALFADLLREHPWPAVVRRWAPILLPGSAGALTHGLLRVAHAVRAMPVESPPSDVLIDELTLGLAYWAATALTLPGAAGADGAPELQGRLPVDAAIARLPRPDEPWSPIEAATFTRVGELADFPAAVTALARPSSLDDGLSDLTAAFCHVLLANPQVFPQGLVHAVTPIAAVRTLLPYLPDDERDSVYARVWQTSAAIVCGFAPNRPAMDRDGRAAAAARDGRAADQVVLAPNELAARAVEHRDPHAIKFTEACLREHRRRPDPVYLRAAQHVIDHMPRW